MNKSIGLLSILMMTSVANGTLFISVNGTLDSHIYMNPGEYAAIGVFGDGGTPSNTRLFLFTVGPCSLDAAQAQIFYPGDLSRVEAGLIPDDYIIRAFFRAEKEELERFEGRIAEYEGRLAEAVEEARNILEYEADEGEEITAKLMKDELKSALKSLSTETYRKALDTIISLETEMKDTRKLLKEKNAELMLKIEAKRFGVDDQKNEYLRLSVEIEEALFGLPEGEKNKRERLKKDYAAVERKLEGLRKLVESVGGVITEKEARDLILQKHHDIISDQLMRYLNAEKRALIGIFENLYDKYAVSAKKLEQEREKTLTELNVFLKGMKYLG